ncbi:MAG: 3-keto-5-aminohexanoate cleavage protein [Lachnospiraceae bacterium]|jgi:3-keto-5-aminohexanoate cleavage enzyme
MKHIITAALTGAVTPKEKNNALPITPKEIAADAISVWKEGAAIVHLHMRDDEGIGTMDKERFKETVQRIRDNTNLVINLTSSGETGAADERRMAHIIELKPELASYDIDTFNWLPGKVFMNTPEFLRKLGKALIENGVKPEIEVFDYGMINAAAYYQQKEGVLPEGSLHFQFCLGVIGQAAATPYNLSRMVDLIPEGSTWSAFGIGTGHMPILYTAIALGGNVRVGLEDNIYMKKGELATNTKLVKRAADCIRQYGNEVATPDDAREILGLRKK